MILAVIEMDKIARTCPREFLKLRLNLAKANINMKELAIILDRRKKKISTKTDTKDTSHILNIYDKLVRKFKKIYKVDIKLTVNGAWDPTETQYWSNVRNQEIFFDKDGEPIPREKYAECIWVTQNVVPPFYKKVGIELVERR